jgi:serine/threonine protein kinase
VTAPLAPGRELVPGYRVIAHLSRNQALDVYDLYSAERDCRCVGKLLRPDRADARSRARLRCEAEILLGLTHPHVVRAYELVEGPRPVLVLETLTGATLGGLLEQEGTLPADDVVELGLQLCSAIGYLHRRGWLHLDLKPDNIVAERGLAKVLDLSLAHRPGPVGAGVGTRAFMAPEQAVGGELAPAADVWGIGAVLFTVASGHAPFVRLPRPHERYPQLRHRAPRLDGDLGASVGACLEPHPADRPALAELAGVLSSLAGRRALAAELRRGAAVSPRRRRRMRSTVRGARPLRPSSRTMRGWKSWRRSSSTAATTASARPSALSASWSPRYHVGIRCFSWSCSEVAISPGKTVVTETPVPASSWRSASANARCAALVAP